MWQKFFAGIILATIEKVLTRIVNIVADGIRTRKYQELHDRLDVLEDELRKRPRLLTKDEAATIARKLSDIRNRV